MSDIVQESLDRVGRISVVPIILEIICRTTGLGFAAVARVTPERWIACEVRDEISFGLKPGGELKVDTTICHEIRQSGVEVIIDHVDADSQYCGHHTPAMYGFQSYISVPIVLKDKTFFGTLCAIDPRPAMLKDTGIRELFIEYASLIALLIDAETLPVDACNHLRQRSIMALRAHFLKATGMNVEEHADHNDSVIAPEIIVVDIKAAIADIKALVISLKAGS